jgi:hypothetical protein
VIDADHGDRHRRDRHHGRHRLFTTLLDHRADPPPPVQPYHEVGDRVRYYALRHTLLHARVLRSGDRPGLEQELWGLLATYQVLRMAMTDAAQTGGLDPDRASFTIALETARDTLAGAAAILPTTGPDGRIDLTGTIGRAVLAHPLPARRARYSARKVKSPISRYHARPADDDRPLATTSIATVTTQIHEPVAGQQVATQPVTSEPVTPAFCSPGVTPTGRGHGPRHGAPRNRRCPPPPRRHPTQPRRRRTIHPARHLPRPRS